MLCRIVAQVAVGLYNFDGQEKREHDFLEPNKK